MSEVIIFFHVGILILTVAVILFADFQGVQWVRGKKEVLSKGLMDGLHTIVTIGLSGMLLTGIILFWPLREYSLTEKAFFLKLFFIFILICNSFAIEHHAHLATTTTYKNIPNHQKIILFLSGGISFIGWIGAIIAATQLF